MDQLDIHDASDLARCDISVEIIESGVPLTIVYGCVRNRWAFFVVDIVADLVPAIEPRLNLSSPAMGETPHSAREVSGLTVGP
jgi:hypothetical protein